MLLTPLASGGCPGGGVGLETGEACLDSKDNDGDGLADCDDSDCASLWLCRPPGQTLDLGAPPPPPDGSILDGMPPALDTGPPPQSSYGQPCQWQGFVSLCSDQKTVCVQSPLGGSFCTVPCSGTGSCPAGPGASNVSECFYSFNNQTYCVFLCMLFSQPYDCPNAAYRCVDSDISSQKWCWL